jgi:drug/metabolite transporter superfamily protein YnfA
MRSSLLAISVLLIAALFEVAGDAVIRRGMRGGGALVVLIGFVMLGTYGVVVNLLGWEFSRLFGVYVAVFATVAVLVGRFVFQEVVPISTWTGLAVVVVGGLIIQFGPSIVR